MSGKRKRLDTGSRRLTESERRKRRNLEDFPGVADSGSGGGDPPEGGCPNLGPTDAAQERCTVQTTAEVAGTPYQTVDLAATAVIPGTDVLSYCFEGKVGPPTGVILIACDGKWGLKTSGLITSDLIDGVLVDGFWDRWVEKGGTWDLKYHAYEDKWAIRGRANNFLPVSEDFDFLLSQITLDNPRDTFAIQARTRVNNYGGAGFTEDPTPNWPGEGSRHGATGLASQWVEGIIPPEVGKAYQGYQFQGFGGGAYGQIGQDTGVTHTVIAGLPGVAMYQLTFFTEDDYQECYYVNGGQTGIPLTAIDAIHKNVQGAAGLSHSVDMYNGVHWNAWSEWQDIYICTEKRIYLTNIPTGWYGRLIPYEGLPTTKSGMPEATGTVIFASDNGTPTGSGLDWHRWPFQGFELYDAKPIGDGGTGVLQEQCFPPRGVFPGDVWDYSSTGSHVIGDGALDVQATIELQILDSALTVISTEEPLGTKSEGWLRGSSAGVGLPQTIVLGISIPWNARYLKFTPYKRGVGDGYGCVRNLQVNTGGELCCEFTIPGSAQAIFGSVGAAGFGILDEDDIELADLDQDGVPTPHVTVVLDPSRETALDPDDPDNTGAVAWTGEQIGDAWEEHRQSSINLMGFDAHPEQDGPTGYGKGYGYDRIDVNDFGIIPGTDEISVRFKAKVV